MRLVLIDDKYRVEPASQEAEGLVRVLGSGAIRAQHMVTGKTMVVRLLPETPEPFTAETWMRRLSERFVTQPNLLELLDAGTTNNRNYLVFPPLEGYSLAEWLDGAGPPPEREFVANVLLSVLRGLAAAHAYGVAHGNLTLDRVFICSDSTHADEQVKLVGFENALMGTPAAEPEQSQDVIACGALIERLLAAGSSAPLLECLLPIAERAKRGEFYATEALLRVVETALAAIETPANGDSVEVYTVGVALLINDQRRTHQLEFRPRALDYAPEPVRHTVEGDVRAQLSHFQARVTELLDRARLGQSRDLIGVEAEVSELSRLVLPNGWLQELRGSAEHLQLDIDRADTLVQSIPWEALTESYAVCDGRERHRLASATPRCPLCGAQVNKGSGALGLHQQLSHFVRGPKWTLSAAGGRFVLIFDPLEDLCAPMVDPRSVCAAHLQTVTELLQRQGFVVDCLRGRNASRGRVLRKLASRDVVGIYYFGHGYVTEQYAESGLELADGKLGAREIFARHPAAQFVFLNACHGATSGLAVTNSEGLSVAEAFAKGSTGKVAIASLWPLVNTQAAEVAVALFEKALGGASWGRALLEIRQQSHARYESGAPDLSWLAYRYYGSPNARLELPADRRRCRPGFEQPSNVMQAPKSSRRAFHEDGRLRTEVYTFDIDAILLRAKKRAALHSRRVADLSDIVAGMVRAGDLTRHVLTELGCGDVDALYQVLLARTELEVRKAVDESLLIALKADPATSRGLKFSPEASELFDGVFEVATREAHDREASISEWNVLRALTQTSAWPTLRERFRQLPEASALRAKAEALLAAQKLDENGQIQLDDLDSDARSVLEAARELAERANMDQIRNRAMLAAFLREPEGFASRKVRESGREPRKLALWLLSSSDADQGSNRTGRLGLTPASSAHLVTPMLDHARRAGDRSEITEVLLFEAFCQLMDPLFKRFLRDGPLRIDFDAFTPDAFLDDLDDGAREVVFKAHRLAQERGARSITNRLLITAFLDDLSPERVAVRLLKQHTRVELQHVLALCSTPRELGKKYPLDHTARARAVTPTLRAARTLGPPPYDEEKLFRAFCVAAPREFKHALRKTLRIDLDALVSAPAATSVEEQTRRVPAHADLSAKASAFDHFASEKFMGQDGTEYHRVEFDVGAWRALETAAGLARSRGWPEVRSPHLFAALLDVADSAVARRLGVQASAARDLVLRMVPERRGRHAEVRFGDSICRLIAQARANQTTIVTEQALVDGLLSGRAGAVVETLKRAGISTLPN